jgi:hypothetical protein
VNCRTVDEVLAAAAADSLADPPLTQAQADLLAAIRTAQPRPVPAAA